MFPESLCGFCQELPVVKRKKAGRESRCPLCKSKLITGDEGKTYRFVEEEEPPSGHYVKHWWQKLGVGAVLLAVALGSAILYGRQGPTVEPQRVAAAKTFAPSEPVTELPAAAPGVEPVVEAPRSASKSANTVSLSAKIDPGDVVVATAKMRFQPVAEAKPFSGVARHYASMMYLHQPTDDELFTPLSAVPEVSLEDKSIKAKSARDAGQALQDLAKVIEETNNKEIDAFIRQAQQHRADLAGLPFLLGKACRAETSAAKALTQHSLLIRQSLGAIERLRSSYSSYSELSRPHLFWNNYDEHRNYGRNSATINDADMVREQDAQLVAALPALHQILAIEEPGMRLHLLQHIGTGRQHSATQLLARYALFDPDMHVRNAALMSLSGRPQGDYEDLLLTALRHPWRPVAQRAAQAIMFLRCDGLVPRLVDLLDSPDPTVPTLEQVGKTKVYMVREMVRVNHHRNCLLCHPPVDREKVRNRTALFPIGAVPVPGQPLPPSTSTVYYESFRPGTVVVRADVTYLRQDFSVLLPVPDHGKWPEKQRFDFLLRTRQITPEEAARRQNGPNMHHHYVRLALQALLRKDLGPDTQAWRDEIARLEPSPSRFGNRPCVR